MWPGEEGRIHRLRRPVAAAHRHPGTVRRGDLLDDLATVSAARRSSSMLCVLGGSWRRPFALRHDRHSGIQGGYCRLCR
ncbi:MAG: DUF2332 family protein [Actinomycetota bacterium]|nr:DUF2332 family protein [Actinomycetota bacterium]MDA8315741.1 DUF2332 family protein [Actinomycetota bacterium]